MTVKADNLLQRLVELSLDEKPEDAILALSCALVVICAEQGGITAKRDIMEIVGEVWSGSTLAQVK